MRTPFKQAIGVIAVATVIGAGAAGGHFASGGPTTTTTGTTTTGTTTTTPTTGTSNIWLSTVAGGSCTYSVSAVAFSQATSCGGANSFQTAYGKVPATGGLVTAACGSYDAQSFTQGITRSGMVVFQPSTPKCATIEPVGKAPGVLSPAPDTTSIVASVNFNSASWITIQDFNINGYQTQCPAADQNYGGQAAVQNPNCRNAYNVLLTSSSAPATHISILNNLIDVGKLNGGDRIVYFRLCQFCTADGNTIGPDGFGADEPGSPVAFDIGKPGAAAPSCTSESCDITISNNLIQYADLISQASWPAGFGPPPEPTCTNHGACHFDGIQIFGAQRVHILNNRFYGDACTMMEIQPQGNSLNADFDIIGNTSTTIASQCNGFISVDCHGVNSCGGTWNIGFNESPAQMLFTFETDVNPFNGTTVFNVYGNFLPFTRSARTVDTSTTPPTTHFNATTCGFTTNGGPLAGLTMNYQYNVFRTNGACDATDSTDSTSASLVWVNSAPGPATGLDMHKTGGHIVADSFVTCALLTIGLRCPTGVDVFLNPWPAVTVNAGADQTVRP